MLLAFEIYFFSRYQGSERFAIFIPGIDFIIADSIEIELSLVKFVGTWQSEKEKLSVLEVILVEEDIAFGKRNGFVLVELGNANSVLELEFSLRIFFKLAAISLSASSQLIRFHLGSAKMPFSGLVRLSG